MPAKKRCACPPDLFGMRKATLVCVLLIVLSFAVAFYYYPAMPDQLASHWDAQGQVNGYTSKFWALMIMPVISAFLLALFVFIPKIDPMKENIAKFRGYFDTFIVLIMLFMFYIFILTILWNSGMAFNMVQFLSPAFAILFYYCGILIEHAERNWFIGIRTPWTISSDVVWKKTHKIGGKLFKIAGLLAVLGIFDFYPMLFVLAPILLVAAYTVVYSYLEYQKLPRKKK